MRLSVQHQPGIREAGLDEAGRGCLAGPVVAGAVILPEKFRHPELTDSKKLSHKKRLSLREVIIDQAISWSIGILSHTQIDKVNILKASFYAMHEAVDTLHIQPEALLVDGNRFIQHTHPHTCMVKGDSRFLNIAAASILAKTFRDEIMERLALDYPQYHWESNKGYPTLAHKLAIREHGLSPFHRKTFNSALPPEFEF
ncbi:MAG TPA: ribonuclease HII [Bacteroidetes bacterium]|nr:ribonuclease HII [Bacteroidota bacterium]